MKSKISELFSYDNGEVSIVEKNIEETGLKLKCELYFRKEEWKHCFDWDDNSHVISYRDKESDVWYPYMLHEYMHAFFYESFPYCIRLPIALSKDIQARKNEIDYCFNTANDWFVNAYIMKLYPTEMKAFLSEPCDQLGNDLKLQQLNTALAYAESATHLNNYSFLPINDPTIKALYDIFMGAPTEMSWKHFYEIVKGLFKVFGNLDMKESDENGNTYWDIFQVSVPIERFAQMKGLRALSCSP